MSIATENRSVQTQENPLFSGLSCNRGGEIRTRDLLNPMPMLGVRQRPWVLSLSLALEINQWTTGDRAIQ